MGRPAADVEIVEGTPVAVSPLVNVVAEGNCAASDAPLPVYNDESKPVGASAVLLRKMGGGVGKERGVGVDTGTSSEAGIEFEMTVSEESRTEVGTWLLRVMAGPELESILSETTSVGVDTSPLVLVVDPKISFVTSERKSVVTDDPLRGKDNAELIIVDMPNPDADPFAPTGLIELGESPCKVLLVDAGGRLVPAVDSPDLSLNSGDCVDAKERSPGPPADDNFGSPSMLFGGGEMAAGYTISPEIPWDGILDSDSSGTAIVVM